MQENSCGLSWRSFLSVSAAQGRVWNSVGVQRMTVTLVTERVISGQTVWERQETETQFVPSALKTSSHVLIVKS